MLQFILKGYVLFICDLHLFLIENIFCVTLVCSNFYLHLYLIKKN